MAPRLIESVITENDELGLEQDESYFNKDPKGDYKNKYVWLNIIIMAYFHIGAFYALFFISWRCRFFTLIWAVLLYAYSALGITAGAHRLWSHRAYKARLPLRIFLMIANSVAAQNSILEWCKDHRVHHKYSETNADPHNAERGFFFSHVGWLLVRKHPEVISKGKLTDFSDLEKEGVVAFQHRHYMIFYFVCCFIMPTLIPYFLWSETLWNSYWIAAIFRYVFTLNCTWLVNSLAHTIGIKPYDGSIGPVENLCVILGAFGEGFHNFHHTFPHHYATSEFGIHYNPTTLFIDIMAQIGLAYDLKTVPDRVIKKTMEKYGDGSQGLFPHLKGRV